MTRESNFAVSARPSKSVKKQNPETMEERLKDRDRTWFYNYYSDKVMSIFKQDTSFLGINQQGRYMSVCEIKSRWTFPGDFDHDPKRIITSLQPKIPPTPI